MRHVIVSGQYAGRARANGLPQTVEDSEEFAYWAGQRFNQNPLHGHKVICAGDSTKIKEELLDESSTMALVETHFKKNTPRDTFQILNRLDWIEGWDK